MPSSSVVVRLLPLIVVSMASVAHGSGTDALTPCLDPLAIIANERFRHDVQLLYGELYSRSGEPIQLQYDHILDQRKKELGRDTDPDIERLDTLINEIVALQFELKRLTQDLDLMDDYDDEGGVATYLQTVRAESSRTDARFVARRVYLARPRPEKIEEMRQSYLRNQVLIRDYDAALAAQGVQPDELRQLRDADQDDVTESDSPKPHSVGRRLAWRRTSLDDDWTETCAGSQHDPGADVTVRAMSDVTGERSRTGRHPPGDDDGAAEPSSVTSNPIDIWTEWGLPGSRRLSPTAIANQWGGAPASETGALKAYPPKRLRTSPEPHAAVSRRMAVIAA